jgi:Glyoxalase-like domain
MCLPQSLREYVGVSEDELGLGVDRIADPAGRVRRIWFQVVPEKKTLKNRLHLDITVSGRRPDPIQTRRRRVDTEAQRLQALGATPVRVLYEDGLNHYRGRYAGPRGQRVRHQLRGGWPGAAIMGSTTARASASRRPGSAALTGRHAKQIICAPGSRNL